MKRKSIWILLGLLVAMLVCAFAGCKSDETTYELSDKSISLTVGEEKQLTISPVPEVKVSWESSNSGVAAVANGLVSAIGAGEATVSAKIEGVEAPLTCTVTVEAPVEEVDGYRLDFSSVSLKTGETFQINVVNEEGQSAQSVVYSSDDSAIATVSESGLITAVANGETSIKAQLAGGTLVCKVTVAQAFTYSLDKTEIDLAAGASDRITLITTPDGVATSRPHTFTSSDETVVTVNGGTGKLKGIAKGTATITCLVDGEELTATVRVTEYSVTIGGAPIAEEMSLLLGDNKEIVVTADPTREFTPEYASSDESIVAVENGHVVAKKMGEATITVSVAGRDFQTTITVESGYNVNYENVTLNLGATDGSNTVRLEVKDTMQQGVKATYESSNTDVATVNEDGLVTAVGFGTATITSRISESVAFETTVSVVPASSLAHKDYTFGSGAVNLTYLDSNKTIDWRWYYNNDGLPTRMKDNVNLIGDYDKGGNTDELFWDYKAPVVFEDAEENKSGAYTYGRAVHGSFTIPVKVTNAVSKIVILTGSWKETATIEFKLGETVLQTEQFVGGEDALARKYELSINTDALGAGESLELTIAVNCNRQHDGNVSLVSVAVVGKEAHAHAVTATTTAQVTTGLSGVQNVTEAGSLDWLAANGTRKAGVPQNTVINESGISYDPNMGTAHDYKDATLTWTDGTAAAPENYKTFHHADNCASIPVLLYKGQSTVTIFATGWNCGYFVAVYDHNGMFVNGHQGADENKDNSVTSKIAITIDVPETNEYTFRIMKCRGAGNSGWAAIAVSSESDIAPEELEYNLVKEGNNEATIALSGSAPSVTYTSGDSEIATVDASGKITAVNAGKTYITIADGTTERRVYVTVTEYTLKGSDSLTLSIGATSQIEIEANPASEFTATYKSSDEQIATVDEKGCITGVSAGDATITATVGGKELQIAVKVEGYKLSATEMTLRAGETGTLEVSDASGSAVSGVTFSSSDEDVATVSNTGLVTAKSLGSAVIKASIGSVELSCTVNVKIDVAVNATDYADGSDNTVNLDELDTANETLDWHFFRNDTVHKMNGGNLIGDLKNGKSNTFGDYRVHMTWYNGATEKASVFGYTDGWTFNQGVSFDVTVTSDVKYIAIFTGAWHAKNIVTISYEDKDLAKFEFENNANSETSDKNKQIVFTPDMAHFGTESKTFTVTLTTAKESANGWADNVSLVAIAVVGNTARTAYTPVSAPQESHMLTANGDPVNLTEVGTLDWMYICDNTNGTVKKNGVENVIHPINAIGGQGGGGDSFANQSFTWTDGSKEPLGDGKTDHFKWCDNTQAICVTLTKSAKVTLWISAWKDSVDVSVYDRTTQVLTPTQVINGNGSNSQGVMVEITLNVTEETVFTFHMKKTTANGGNFGLGAVAVAEINGETPAV